MTSSVEWQAEGILLDMCNCELLCPCHVSFRQKAAYDICEGFWVASIEKGNWGQVSLNGLAAVVAFHCPNPIMFDGDWNAVLYIDQQATPEQEEALVSVFSGQSGGPWSRLAVFYRDGRYQVIKRADIRFNQEERTFRVEKSPSTQIEVRAIPGADREGEAKISNLRNVIHGEEHILAHSDHRIDDEGLKWEYAGKNGLYSRFSWSGP